ncbi:MAG: serine hydrolase [Sphingomicrobium sp.]
MITRATATLLGLLVAGCASVPSTQSAPVAVTGVAFDLAGERGSFNDGLADPGAGRAITPNDPARIASISKLVVAIGAMRLVEQGKLDLGSDVSRWLGWTLRNPAHPDQPINLAMLLSHTSSVRDHDDQYAIPLGQSVEAAMADPRSWDARHGAADHYFTYSNMNFPIVGSIVERVTGERFDIWMRREVLNPMRIDACYNWPTCSDQAIARAVVLTQGGKAVRDDLGGNRPDCPVFVADGEQCDLTRWRAGDNGALFAPQGGLRISARGLARVGRMLLNRGTLDGAAILSPQSVDTLLAQHWRFDGRNGVTDHGFYCSFGLATQQIPNIRPGCNDDPAGDGVVRVGHAGEAYGLRSGLWIDPAHGTGIAYFVTGLPDNPKCGRSAFRDAEEAAFKRALALAGK